MTAHGWGEPGEVKGTKASVLAPERVKPRYHPDDLFANFGLRTNPFGVTPDTRYFFESRTHVRARSSLQLGVDSGVGFVALIAAPGMGKTTILFDLLKHYGAHTKTAFLFQVYCNSHNLLASVAADFGLDGGKRDVDELIRYINHLLLRMHYEGKRTILIVDEAQNLSNSNLEALRVLSNFETQTHKLLQIILCGQPQLGEKLSSPELQQLSQRISIVTSLEPFTLTETKQYVAQRLRLAGSLNASLFSDTALDRIYDNSKGVPREINRLCFNALLLAKEAKTEQVQVSLVEKTVQARKHAFLGAASLYPEPLHRLAPVENRGLAEARRASLREPVLLDSTSILASLAEEAKMATGADGVALLFGDEQRMVCWAKSGQVGLNVSSRAYADTGLIGYCMRSAEIQLCRDCERDIRVDLRSISGQNIKSIVYLPLIWNKRLHGICGLFSSRADHFSVFDRQTLKRTGDQIVMRLSKKQDLLDLVFFNEQRKMFSVPEKTEHVSNSVPRAVNNSTVGSATGSGIRHDFPWQLSRFDPVQELSVVDAGAQKPLASTPRVDTRPTHMQQGPVAHVQSSRKGRLRFALTALVIFGVIGFNAVPEFRALVIAIMGEWSTHVRRSVDMAMASAPRSSPYVPAAARPYGIDFLDRRKAIPYLQGTGSARSFAQQSDPHSEYQFADTYPGGMGVPQDFGKRVRWFERAAEEGMATAQWKLGLAFLHGVGIAADDERAAYWIKRAADQGNPLAQSALSELYFAGRGTNRDLVKAYTWAVIAMKGLQPDQVPNIQLLRQSLTSQQLANAEKRIASWSRQTRIQP